MSDELIKEALNLIPYGFYAITSRSGEEVNVMVANWLTQVSFEPRLVALALQKTSHTHSLVQSGRVFAVNIFAQADEDAIKPFTKSRAKNPEKTRDARYTPGPVTGCPILEGIAAYLEVEVTDILDVGGDHDIVVGRVAGAGVEKEIEVASVLNLPDLGWSYAG